MKRLGKIERKYLWNINPSIKNKIKKGLYPEYAKNSYNDNKNYFKWAEKKNWTYTWTKKIYKWQLSPQKIAQNN